MNKDIISRYLGEENFDWKEQPKASKEALEQARFYFSLFKQKKIAITGVK